MILLVKSSLSISKLDLEHKKLRTKKYNVFKLFQLHTANITSAIFFEICDTCVENIILQRKLYIKLELSVINNKKKCQVRSKTPYLQKRHLFEMTMTS